MHPSELSIRDFSYELPANRIAYHPLDNRDASKLLIYKDDIISEHQFSNIADYLTEDNLLIFNNTKVINARLIFQKPTGAKIEIFCLEPKGHEGISGMHGQAEWICMVGGAAKWKGEILEKKQVLEGREVILRAELLDRSQNAFHIRFTWTPTEVGFEEVIRAFGHVPLPPYIKREIEKEDEERYQTIYAKTAGSVAAPTAGLHFSEKVLMDLERKGIRTAAVTLHVSAGTFKPVDAEKMSGHQMHPEWFCVQKDLILHIAEHQGPITAVGTTSVRTLETLYWLGVKCCLQLDLEHLQLKQWEVYQSPLQESRIDRKTAMEALLKKMEAHGWNELVGSTELMIAPGYRFRVMNAIITNFHQPGSTLLLLVAAAVGEDWKKIYDYALHHDFRFLSFGDSSLLFLPHQG